MRPPNCNVAVRPGIPGRGTRQRSAIYRRRERFLADRVRTRGRGRSADGALTACRTGGATPAARLRRVVLEPRADLLALEFLVLVAPDGHRRAKRR